TKVQHLNPINQHTDIVFLVLFENDSFSEFLAFAVDYDILISLRKQIVEQLVILALTTTDHRCKDFNILSPFLLPHTLKDKVLDLFEGKFLDLSTADNTMRLPNSCIKNAQVVIDLCNGRNSRAWIS